ncbi:transglycosylase domain-containing protein [Streptomyces sp. NPDC051219]|uniref:transglycosylase domain-containing protein n=1 Tax=Streptomyces sp. NPDC051219 TaxID=3155283 RepID=UPI003445C2A0
MGRAEARRARQGGARRARKAKKPGGIRRFFSWKKMLGTFFGLCLLVMGAFVALYLYVDEPQPNAQARLQSNIFKYSDGKKVLARTGQGVNRQIVGLDRIPRDVQMTFLAAENKSFYEDSGIDFKGTARGLLNTLSGKGKQGGSTITQQYVKNYYLEQDQSVTRKLKELVISLKVDQRMDKDDILAGYINTSYYGRGAHGIQAAAQAYYGIDADKLNVAQGAYLAALLQAPSSYDWHAATPTGRKFVQERWDIILGHMIDMGKLDEAKRATLKFPIPNAPKAAPGLEGQTGYLVEAARAELERSGVSKQDLDAGGWTITLNIDEKKQKKLEQAVEDQLESKLDRKKNQVDATVQAGATSVDPKTGRVVAMYGGTDATKHWINNATRTDYQPGSTFKPFVLASAMENGSVTQDGKPIKPNTVYDGTSRRPVEGSDTPFAPQNLDNRSWGPVTVQKGTNHSLNSVYAQMIVDVGPDKVKKTALDLGMKDRGAFDERPAMSLGPMGSSTLDMAAAYATLDNHGEKVTPAIVKAAKHESREADLPEPLGGQAISRESADTVTKVLTGVVNEGSANAVKSSSYEAAGKTGTSEQNKSAWFTGYTPELTTVVALFGESTKEGGGQVSLTGTANSGRANGGGFPARIWKQYTSEALAGGDVNQRFDLETDMGVVEATQTPTQEPTETQEPDPTNTPTGEPDPTRTPTRTPDPTTTPDPTESADGGLIGGPGGDTGGGDTGGGNGSTGGDTGGDENTLRPPRP